MQVFSGMDLETQIHSRFLKRIQDRQPARGQLVEGGLDESGGALRPGVNVRPGQRSGKSGVGLEPQVRRRLRRKQQLLHCPFLPRLPVSTELLGRESIEHQIVSGMHSHQLPLQMSGKLSQMQTVRREGIEHVVAISFAFRGQLQVKQAAIPGRDLHALVAQTGSPVRDIVQIVERSRVTGKLGQKYRRALNGFHVHREFALSNIRQLIYTSREIKGKM